jgi:anti-sigma factor RsiW
VNCQDLRDKLLEYVDGELVGEEKTRAVTHLGECDDCTVYLETYTHTVTVVKRLPKCGPLPAGVAARLRDRLKEHLTDGATK